MRLDSPPPPQVVDPSRERNLEASVQLSRDSVFLLCRYDFENFTKNIKCLRCNDMSEEKIKESKEEFQHLPLKKGDWICRSCRDHHPFALTFRCNFLIFAKNTRCLLCQEKPAGRQLNQGEWECSSWKQPKTTVAVVAEEQGSNTMKCHFSRISSVKDELPSLVAQPPFVEEARETPPMDSMLSELDGSDHED